MVGRSVVRRAVLLVALLAVAVALARPARAEAVTPVALADTGAATDDLLFAQPLDAFVRAGIEQFGGTSDEALWRPGELLWSTDGCSNPFVAEPQRSQPLGFDFRAACWRHDFGYRNLGRQHRLTEATRQQVDDLFLRDMTSVCAAYTGWQAYRGVLCRDQAARAYYQVVRGCGSSPTPWCAGPILATLRLAD